MCIVFLKEIKNFIIGVLYFYFKLKTVYLNGATYQIDNEEKSLNYTTITIYLYSMVYRVVVVLKVGFQLLFL